MRTPKRRAFTMIELLVTVALIALLATITAVALRPIRTTAKRTDSMNAIRQMVLGYAAYTSDNNGALMPGAVSPSSLDLLGLNPKLASGVSLDGGLAYNGGGASDPSDASSYVWRLSPYLDDTWKTMYTDYASGDIVDVLSNEVNNPGGGVYGEATMGPNDLGAARVPSFGMNCVFVGGNDVYGGPAITNRNPWAPTGGLQVTTLAATRLSEARNPSKLMVFAPSRYTPGEQASRFPSWSTEREIMGSPEIRPPFLTLEKGSADPTNWLWIERQWHIKSMPGGLASIPVGDPEPEGGAVFSDGGGLPVARWGDQIPVGRLDGSVTSYAIERLFIDMRLWSPFETVDAKVDR